jgi:hypothetical protein
MTSLPLRARFGPPGRALAVLAAALVLVAAVMVATAGRAASAPKLPALPADQLAASTIRALGALPPVSGSVAARVDLGLPQLLDSTYGAAASQVNSLFGDHRMRVWASADGLKVADLLAGAERSVTVDARRRDAWAWDSGSSTAYHLHVPERARPEARPGGVPTPDPLTLARLGLAELAPTTAVSVAGNAWVAGRAAYTLVLEPRSPATLVGRVEIGVDAERRVPLRVSVYPRGSRVARVSAAFTSVRFGRVPASTFAFAPPPGAKVRQGDVAGPPGAAGQSVAGYRPRTFGVGWATVAAVPVQAPEAARRPGSDALDPSSFLPFSGPLFSASLVQRGDHAWLLVGAVPQRGLAAVESELR